MALALLVAVAVGVLGVRAAWAGTDTSCAVLKEGKIVESHAFTPYGQRYGPPEGPIRGPGSRDALPPHRWIPTDTLDGLPLQYATGDTSLGRRVSAPSEFRLFLDRPVDRSMTLTDVLTAGGISFRQYPVDPVAPGVTSPQLIVFVGGRAVAVEIGRAVAVEIGPYAGSLTWGDPLATGVRPHHLFWSDGVLGYTLIADRSAVAITNLARSMVCGWT